MPPDASAAWFASASREAESVATTAQGRRPWVALGRKIFCKALQKRKTGSERTGAAKTAPDPRDPPPATVARRSSCPARRRRDSGPRVEGVGGKLSAPQGAATWLLARSERSIGPGATIARNSQPRHCEERSDEATHAAACLLRKKSLRLLLATKGGGTIRGRNSGPAALDRFPGLFDPGVARDDGAVRCRLGSYNRPQIGCES